jgi:MFS family permease
MGVWLGPVAIGSIFGAVLVAGLLAGLAAAPRVERPEVAHRRLLLAGLVLLAIGAVIGGIPEATLAAAAVAWAGLFVAGIGVGIVLYYTLWAAGQLRQLRAQQK